MKPALYEALIAGGTLGGALLISNNLSDVADRKASRYNLGLGLSRTYKDFGVAQDGTTDDAANLQNAITTCASLGLTLLGGDGTCKLLSPLNIPSGLNWQMTPGCIHNGVFLSGSTMGFLGQTGVTTSGTKISGVRIKGGQFTHPDNTDTYKGRMCFLWGNDIVLEDIVFRNAATGGFLFIGGNEFYIRNVRCYNGAQHGGVEGIRVFGSGDSSGTTGVVCSDCYAESGDDTFQLVVAANNTGTTQPLTNLDIYNSGFINCHGISYFARIMSAGQVNLGGSTTMTANIKNFWFVACSGQSAYGCQLENQCSSGVISDGFFGACHFNASLPFASASDFGFQILAFATFGGIQNITYDGGSIRGVTNTNLSIIGVGLVSGVTIRNVQMDAPSSGSDNAVIIDGVSRIKLDACNIRSGGADTIKVGATTTVNGFVLEDCFVETGNASSTTYCVALHGLTGGQIRRNLWGATVGASNPLGIHWIGAGVTFATSENNDYSNLPGKSDGFVGAAGNGKKNNINYGHDIVTTDATTTTLVTVLPPGNSVVTVEGTITARRTGGTSGSSDDSAVFRVVASFKNAGLGSVSAFGNATLFTQADQGWTVGYTVSGAQGLIQITGAANNNVAWTFEGEVRVGP